MNVGESVRIAWRSIRDHRLRSVLTTLGVIIGVAAVIAFVALGASLQGGVVAEFTDDRSPSMTVTTTAGDEGIGGFGPGGQAVFTAHDVEQLEQLAGVRAVVPEAAVPMSGIRYRSQVLSLQSITATTPVAFDQPGSGNFSAGGPFTPGEREVVVNEPAASMFDQNVSVDDRVTFERSNGEAVNATVVGIVSDADESPGRGGSRPTVYGPLDPFHTTTLTSPTTGAEERVYPRLTIIATGFEEVQAVEDRVDRYLQADSDAVQLLPDAYSIAVLTTAGITEQIENVIGTFTRFIVGIAVISLIVGVIGIANIMLVSVTERTREIGIMKAVGAQNRDILQLFLMEATMLGLIGAIVGSVLGVVAAFVATVFIGLPFTFPLWWVAIAILMGVGVGVSAGLYPAWNAARTDPIDALRHE